VETYGIRVGEGPAIVAKVVPIELVTSFHILLFDFLLLMLRQRGLLVHATRKLISSCFLGTKEISHHRMNHRRYNRRILTFSCA